MVCAGCSPKNTSNDVFSSSESVENNTKIIPASFDTTWNAALELLGHQGFNVNQIDLNGKILSASKEVKNKDDDEVSHTVKVTITAIPVSEQQTRTMISANQITELHKKSYVWWHLLWIFPLIPIDTEYTTVVTERDTIHSQDFYQDFFAGLLTTVSHKNH